MAAPTKVAKKAASLRSELKAAGYTAPHGYEVKVMKKKKKAAPKKTTAKKKTAKKK
jgi:hypothetical protein